MNTRQRYKEFYIAARSYKLRDGSGWMGEYRIEEHEGAGLTETVFLLREISPTSPAATRAAITSARKKIDVGIEKPVARRGRLLKSLGRWQVKVA
jgi:hypothetical protein